MKVSIKVNGVSEGEMREQFGMAFVQMYSEIYKKVVDGAKVVNIEVNYEE